LDPRLAGPFSKTKLRHILAALEEVPDRLAQFRKALAPRAHSTLPALEHSVRQSLNPREAYNMVPGGDPQIR
jgi:hypothetical protein